MDKKRSENRKMLEGLEEKMKIGAKAWHAHAERQFSPQRSCGVFFRSKIPSYCDAQQLAYP